MESTSTSLSIKKIFILVVCLLFVSSLVFAGEVTVKSEMRSDGTELIIYYEDNKEIAREIAKRELTINKYAIESAANFQIIESSGRIPDRIIKSYYSDGKLLAEKTFKNGKRNGVTKVYYPSGKLKHKMSYKDNKLDGAFIEYNEDGTVHTEGNLKDNKIEGIVRIYSAGTLTGERIYKGGELIKAKPIKSGEQYYIMDKD